MWTGAVGAGGPTSGAFAPRLRYTRWVAGADDEDRALGVRLEALQAATYELSWLLDRGYAEAAALELVGNKHQLSRRQRMLVRRASTTEAEATGRRRRRVDSPLGLSIAVDGFNQLVTTERGLDGGTVAAGRDGVVRDAASVHGTWRRSRRTLEALDLMVRVLDGASSVLWVLDAPVSNSGRLAALIRARADFEVRLEDQADAALLASGRVLATGDGPLIDRAGAWFPLAELALRRAGCAPLRLYPDSP